MYYLEDKHAQYEYALYVRIKEARPYLLEWGFTDYYRFLNRLNEIKKRHNRYNQVYYIDNDCVDNDYNSCIRPEYYYKILRRPLNDYKVLTKADLSSNTNNIITFM